MICSTKLSPISYFFFQITLIYVQNLAANLMNFFNHVFLLSFCMVQTYLELESTNAPLIKSIYAEFFLAFFILFIYIIILTIIINLPLTIDSSLMHG